MAFDLLHEMNLEKKNEKRNKMRGQNRHQLLFSLSGSGKMT